GTAGHPPGSSWHRPQCWRCRCGRSRSRSAPARRGMIRRTWRCPTGPGWCRCGWPPVHPSRTPESPRRSPVTSRGSPARPAPAGERPRGASHGQVSYPPGRMGSMAPDEAPLRRFSAATREWFSAAFAAPTAAQAGAWDAISAGKHALVVAPTGSGKTLAAFLWSLDRLAAEPAPEPRRRCRVVYVSPLKALAVDVERNLRAPLTGIRHAAARLGLAEPEITVAMRTGDTPPEERRAFARAPSDILITTPESLFLLLTSSAREGLRGVETVIVDEVHAVAGTKRGAHLALSLERLDALLPAPAQRIGLSATVRPVAEVARFLGGAAPV